MTLISFQNPNEDTEWNDILRKKGILPQKEKEVTEADIVSMLETTIEEKQSKSEKILISGSHSSYDLQLCVRRSGTE
jgi:uncharacterized UBP type Zn finger protein